MARIGRSFPATAVYVGTRHPNVRAALDVAGLTDVASRVLSLVRVASDKAAASDQPTSITDNMTGTVNSHLAGRSTTTGGGTWVVPLGDFLCGGSNFQTVGASTDIAYVDCGSADGTISLDVTPNTPYSGVMFRYIDNSNFYAYEIRNDGSSRVVKMSGGVKSALLTGLSGTGATGTLKVVLSGNSMTFFLNGTQVGATSDSSFSSGKHGIYDEDNGVGSTFDNFSYVGSGVAPTGQVNRPRVVSDSLGGTDGQAHAVALPRGTSDSAGGADAATVARQLTFARAALDSAGGYDDGPGITDNFNRADVAAGLGTTSDGKGVWLLAPGYASEFGILNNQAYSAAAGTVGNILNVGSSDGTLQITFSTLAASQVAVWFSYIDDTHNYFVLPVATSPAHYWVYKTKGSAFILLGTGTATAAAGDVVKVVKVGPSINVYVNNVLDISVSDGDYSSPFVGIKKNASVAMSFDDFSWSPATVSPTVGVTRTRTAGDSAPATDSGSRVRAPSPRTTSDSAPAIDVASGVVTTPSISRTASDSAPATDVAGEDESFQRTLSDSAPAVDTNARSQVAARSASDVASLTDSAARSSTQVRTTSDALGLSDGPPPPLYSNSFEGGSSGTAITVANSGGASGDAFSAVSGNAINYDNTHAAHGSLSAMASTTTAAPAILERSFPSATNTVAIRLALYLTANPGALFRPLGILGPGSALRARLQITTTGKLAIENATGSAILTQTGTIPLNQWFRVEIQFPSLSLFTGQVTLSRYDSLDAVTPTETATSAATQSFGGSATLVRYGITTSTANIGPFWFDDIAQNDTGVPIGAVGGPSRIVTLARAATDSAPAADVANESALASRTASDNAPAADVATGAFSPGIVNLSRSGSDAAVLVDSVTRTVVVARTASDVAPAVDSPARTVVASRTVTDSAPAVDTTTRAAQSLARTTTDSAPASDVATRGAQQAVRAGTDAAPASDSVARTARDARAISDAAAAADVVTRALVQARATTDTAPATDAAVRASQAFSRTGADSAPATDFAIASGVTRSGSDSAPAVDTNARNVVVSRTSADGAGAVDSPTRAASVARTVTDLGTLVDVATRAAQGLVRSGADSAPLVDAAARVAREMRTGIDSLATTDVATRHLTETRTTSDAVGLTDATSRAESLARATTDVAAATDSATVYDMRSRSTSDLAPATDQAAQHSAHARSGVDNAAATDAVTRAMGATRTGGDAAPASDSTSRVARWARIGTDGAALVDSAALRVRLGVTAPDAAPADDTTSSGAALTRFVADGATAVDVAAQAVRLLRTLADAAPAVDTASPAISVAPRDIEVTLGERVVVISFGDPRLASIAFGAVVDHITVGQPVLTVATFGEPVEWLTTGGREQVVSVGERQDPITLGTPGL